MKSILETGGERSVQQDEPMVTQRFSELDEKRVELSRDATVLADAANQFSRVKWLDNKVSATGESPLHLVEHAVFS